MSSSRQAYSKAHGVVSNNGLRLRQDIETMATVLTSEFPLAAQSLMVNHGFKKHVRRDAFR